MQLIALLAAAAAVAAALAAGGALSPGRVGLLPPVRSALESLLRALGAAGIRVKVGQTGRTLTEQAIAADAGRSGTYNGQHQKGRAVDLYPIDPGTGFPDYAGRNLELFRSMHAIARAHGWTGLAFNADGSPRYLSAPNGKKFWDGAHLEWHGQAASS